MKANSRNYFLKTVFLFIVILVLELIGYLGLAINSTTFDFLPNKNYFQIRAMLTGTQNAENFPRYLSLPYLGYIPFPGYQKHGVIQHNEDGYRGDRVPLQKRMMYRILCLGGSTTYGFGVELPSQTYPAQMQIILKNYFLHDTVFKKKYCGIEVINAGLEAATSAEILQQYLFKYRYYKPDAILVHTGINDALLESESSPDYQLDYTHHRRINFNLPKCSTPLAWLLKSYCFSYFTIMLFYDDFASTSRYFKKDSNQELCKWTDVKSHSNLGNIKPAQYPFYRNTETLFREMVNDSSTLFILPEVLNKHSKFVINSHKYVEYSNLNNAFLKQLSESSGVFLIPFTFDSIKDPTSWIDDCHLNETGEKNKAQIVSHILIEHLNKVK